MKNDPRPIMPGDRLRVYDLYEGPQGNDMPATVVARYGMVSRFFGYRYPDLVDVQFDHRPGAISRGHFTECCMTLELKGVAA